MDRIGDNVGNLQNSRGHCAQQPELPLNLSLKESPDTKSPSPSLPPQVSMNTPLTGVLPMDIYYAYKTDSAEAQKQSAAFALCQLSQSLHPVTAMHSTMIGFNGVKEVATQNNKKATSVSFLSNINNPMPHQKPSAYPNLCSFTRSSVGSTTVDQADILHQNHTVPTEWKTNKSSAHFKQMIASSTYGNVAKNDLTASLTSLKPTTTQMDSGVFKASTSPSHPSDIGQQQLSAPTTPHNTLLNMAGLPHSSITTSAPPSSTSPVIKTHPSPPAPVNTPAVTPTPMPTHTSRSPSTKSLLNAATPSSNSSTNKRSKAARSLHSSHSSASPSTQRPAGNRHNIHTEAPIRRSTRQQAKQNARVGKGGACNTVSQSSSKRVRDSSPIKRELRKRTR